MIDSDDAEHAALLWPSGGPWWFILLGLVVVGGLAYAAWSNERECAARHCDRGAPRVVDGDCSCLEPATWQQP